MPKHSVTAFLARKDIEVSFQRYAIDALSAMAQGLFASLLIGTILTTVGDLSGVGFFNEIGTFAKSVAGPAMAVAIRCARPRSFCSRSQPSATPPTRRAGPAGPWPCW